ncbi:hypothetical protein EC957_010951 [Mortierella hygrophila]|uniref:Uncharacterized protein n=1 Tax=Mortierella hygrophila TaxID=979708 RepID=A0A9P6K441_9FUNG|nr:hypothetical protein EC957_010951 [Mortierella hygrophila]
MVSATVGFWNTSTTTTPSLTGIKAIRWEGTAPATMTPGTLYPVAFPPNMITQPLAPVEEDGTPKKMHHHKQKFVMDPARGRAVVGLVSAIMIVGIVIGVREVYKAAQYVPPVRSRPGSILNGKGGKGFGGYGRFSGDGSVIGTVGARKVKKKEAYYRKPATSSLFSSSVGGADLQQQQLQQLSTGRSSMTTLATLRATTSPIYHRA